MQATAPLLSDAATERVVRRAATALGLWATGGEAGLGRAPSGRTKARMATLLWADRGDAERWAHLAAVPGRPKFLSLADLFVDVLPKLAELERFVGLGWSEELVRPEIEPCELQQRLREEMVNAFLRKAGCFEAVWILQGMDGPACMMSKARPGAQMLPCWTDRTQAEARIAGPLAGMVAAEVPLGAFCERTLTWVAETGRLVAPGFCEGNGLIEYEPYDLLARLGDAANGEAAA
jgi:hypothetical protein